MRVVYSEHYDIGFMGLEKLHPFDSRKYSRVWNRLSERFGSELTAMAVHPQAAIGREELLQVHHPSYFDQLRRSFYVAKALEVLPLALLPAWLLDRQVLLPMRWATQGTVLAARECMSHGLAVNLGGGYHHAKPAAGEGFCIYSDIAVAIHTLRSENALGEQDLVAYIDLDAHQGNGVCHSFLDDRRVEIFDMFNDSIYPRSDTVARQRIDFALPLPMYCADQDYLDQLKGSLPEFLDFIGQSGKVGLAIYNAGTDIFRGDPLGALGVSAVGVVQRDLFVIRQLRERGIPTVMLLSGGYTQASHELVSGTLTRLMERALGRE